MVTADELLEYLAAEHRRIRSMLIMFFLRRGSCNPEDSADDTITRAIEQIRADKRFGRVAELDYYLLGIARNVLREYRDRPAIPVAASPLTVSSDEKEAREHCIERCLERLNQQDKELIVGYTSITGPDKNLLRTRLAAERNWTITALRLKVFRIRESLRRCLSQCMREVLDGALA
jgi:hypothetical protein